jgi:hypothetical protein
LSGDIGTLNGIAARIKSRNTAIALASSARANFAYDEGVRFILEFRDVRSCEI